MVKLEFIRLQVEHLSEVMEIEKLSFPQPWARAMFEREVSLPISHFFVAKAGDRIAGYGGYWHIEDEAHLINLAVRPELRGKGLGRQILNYLIEAMSSRGIVRILLEVRASNHDALKLYGSSGFASIGLRPKYYVNEDAVLMEKLLGTRERSR
ncbi:MAG: ribosomal protein S18-alanine N-acetyltransferase [Endomicrobiales bacterium]